MDRKRKKKITAYVIVSLCFLLACGGVFYQIGKSRYESQLLWIGAVSEQYPEMEGNLAGIWKEAKENKAEILKEKYGYRFYNTAQGKQLGLQMAGIGVCGLLVIWLGYFIAVRDEKKQKERMKALEELEEKRKEQSAYIEDLKAEAAKEEENTKALITNISHQLKTPLSGLKIMQELGENDELSAEELGDYFQKSKESVEKLTELTEELMRLSKLENHMIRLQPKELSIRDVVVHAVEEMILKAIHKDIEIQMEEMEEDFRCIYDEKWTREALVNVLDNGVKYSKPGGKITIRLQKMQTYGLIEVEDEGIGIHSEEYHKIFGRFYRGKSKEVQSQEGAGVGLYLTRKIIEEQGGTVSVKSFPFGGSTFRLTLPLP